MPVRVDLSSYNCRWTYKISKNCVGIFNVVNANCKSVILIIQTTTLFNVGVIQLLQGRTTLNHLTFSYIAQGCTHFCCILYMLTVVNYDIQINWLKNKSVVDRECNDMLYNTHNKYLFLFQHSTHTSSFSSNNLFFIIGYTIWNIQISTISLSNDCTLRCCMVHH